MEEGELPDAAAAREVLEETQVRCWPTRVVSVRPRPNDVWIAFGLTYESGEPVPDGREVDFAVFVDLRGTRMSQDSGVRWSPLRILVTLDGAGDCGYPSTVQVAAGGVEPTSAGIHLPRRDCPQSGLTATHICAFMV